MRTIAASLLGAVAALALSSTLAAAHGCHPDARLDKYGWHRHARNDCDRINVDRGEYREHRRHRDDDDHPRCVQRCQYIGPIKTCKTVCD